MIIWSIGVAGWGVGLTDIIDNDRWLAYEGGGNCIILLFFHLSGPAGYFIVVGKIICFNLPFSLFLSWETTKRCVLQCKHSAITQFVWEKVAFLQMVTLVSQRPSHWEVFSVYLIDLEKKNQDVSTINITKKLHINLTYIDLASSV